MFRKIFNFRHDFGIKRTIKLAMGEILKKSCSSSNVSSSRLVVVLVVVVTLVVVG